ncbi:MAG: hypothetical protein B7Y09_03905 [Polaromonas sp. 24-63-21]|nr:MAG: hypothetical protein B7Y09_03905 [Polaromonas sp. 24-63-21]
MNLQPQFVMVNGGKSDLLVTEMICRFEHAAPGIGSVPKQKIAFENGSDWLLSSGKARHGFVEFTEPFDGAFAKQGRRDPKKMNLFFFDVYLDIKWIDMDGLTHQKSVQLTQYGLDERGVITMGGLEDFSYNMNDSKVRGIWAARSFWHKKP